MAEERRSVTPMTKRQYSSEIDVIFWQEQRAILRSKRSKEAAEKIRALRKHNLEADQHPRIEEMDMAQSRPKG